MTTSRTYGEACPIAHAMDIVGDRWALLVVRELRLGPRRFSDLQASLPKAGPNMLTQRLRDLERSGVVAKRSLPPPAGSTIYELTPWGSEIEPVFRALARWGVRAPVPPDGTRLSPDSVMLGLRTFFTERHDPAWSATYHISLGRESYRLTVTEGRLTELTRGRVDAPADGAPAATVTCQDHMTMHALIEGREDLPELTDRGELTVAGDLAAVRRLVAAVSKPRRTS
ncbi:helix-turn-helix transcriptional regulator [Phytoactinopolyspora alkaliphila]|uniref:Helix-turn-helix transcriptional regulator n=1 Tax=Phytoactinopolyspora alkaliphila TaxID=1783498 RepID=A0A6N9YHA2_9ACTN|nr:helix-turn-helix domain-containing protein [Phytoactinopolyspora alkaliphila]NED94332.1 helix-turn-helix transcriptional regulator [Phytoactinopolyspora alkaliphila]